jgi:hypothetical protein
MLFLLFYGMIGPIFSSWERLKEVFFPFINAFSIDLSPPAVYNYKKAAKP